MQIARIQPENERDIICQDSTNALLPPLASNSFGSLSNFHFYSPGLTMASSPILFLQLRIWQENPIASVKLIVVGSRPLIFEVCAQIPMLGLPVVSVTGFVEVREVEISCFGVLENALTFLHTFSRRQLNLGAKISRLRIWGQ